MDKLDFLPSSKIAEEAVKIGLKKTELPVSKMIILGFLAGAFIAFAAEGSNMATFNLFLNNNTYGLGKTLAGAIFATGLIMVILAGGELFTGNVLILTGVLQRKIALNKLLKNWFFVYIGNFLGSVFIVWMMNKSGLFKDCVKRTGRINYKDCKLQSRTIL